jgi:hypothetical protein
MLTSCVVSKTVIGLELAPITAGIWARVNKARVCQHAKVKRLYFGLSFFCPPCHVANRPTTLPHLSTMPATRRMTTRSANANTRPGLVQVQANHQVARDKKERPANGDSEDAGERRAAAARRIAELERDIMEEDTDDVLQAPPQNPTNQRRHRERSSSVVTDVEAEAPTPRPKDGMDEDSNTPMPKRRGSKPKRNLFREAVWQLQQDDNLDATDIVEKTPQHTMKSNAPERLRRARESVG